MTSDTKLGATATLRLPEDLKAELAALARAEERSISWLMLRLLREGLERRKSAVLQREPNDTKCV